MQEQGEVSDATTRVEQGVKYRDQITQWPVLL